MRPIPPELARYVRNDAHVLDRVEETLRFRHRARTREPLALPRLFVPGRPWWRTLPTFDGLSYVRTDGTTRRSVKWPLFALSVFAMDPAALRDEIQDLLAPVDVTEPLPFPGWDVGQCWYTVDGEAQLVLAVKERHPVFAEPVVLRSDTPPRGWFLLRGTGAPWSSPTAGVLTEQALLAVVRDHPSIFHSDVYAYFPETVIQETSDLLEALVQRRVVVRQLVTRRGTTCEEWSYRVPEENS